VKRARHLVDGVRIDGAPCRDAMSLSRLAGWAYVHDRLGRLDAAWASLRQPAGGGAALRCAEYADVAATVQDVLRLEDAIAEASDAAACVPGLAAPAWEDDAALDGLLAAVDAAGRERRVAAARAQLDDVLACAGSVHPAEAALRAAVADRDALAYAVAAGRRWSGWPRAVTRSCAGVPWRRRCARPRPGSRRAWPRRPPTPPGTRGWRRSPRPGTGAGPTRG